MKKLLNISSVEYEKAEMLSWFHAVVAPVVITLVFWLSIDSKSGVIGGFFYVIILLALNVARLIISNKPFEHEKSYMYFEALKYLVIFVFFAAIFVVIIVYGVYHV